MKTERQKQIQKNVQEVRIKIRKANNCFVWCVLDGQDVGEYFKTSKTEVLFYVRKYFRDNGKDDYCDFENLNNAVVLRDNGDLYIN